MSPRILVVGAGGIGCYYAARIAHLGGDVAIVARGAALEAIRAHGIRVRSQVHGDWLARVPAFAPKEIERAAPVDWVWLATKAYDTAATIELVRPVIGAETLVTSLQNGVENEELLARAFGRERVLGAMLVLIGSHVVEPGLVAHTGESRFVFGDYPRGESERSRSLAAFLSAHGVNAILTADVEAELWRKLMINDAFNGLSSLTRLDTWTLANDPATAPLVRGMIGEVHAVGVARGVPLAPGDPDHMYGLLKGFAGIQTSMLRDVELGRPTEVEAIVGDVVRAARELGIATPVNDLVYALLSAMERKRAARH